MTALGDQIIEPRRETHDKLEEKAYQKLRKYIRYKHFPDKVAPLENIITFVDIKTGCNVEEKSKNIYFRLLKNGYPVAIVYNDNKYADWIDNLRWDGPKDPSVFSSCGDRYYTISGGRLYKDWLKSCVEEAEDRASEKALIYD